MDKLKIINCLERQFLRAQRLNDWSRCEKIKKQIEIVEYKDVLKNE